jgi:hypothetical protein
MRRSSLRVVLASVYAMCVPTVGHAQELIPGDRIRIAIRERQPQDEAPALRRLVLRGQLTRVAADTLFLRPGGTVGEIGIARATAISIHRSRGVRSRAASAARSGLGLAIAGSLIAGFSYRKPNHTYGVTNRSEAFALGAGIGALTGIVFGALLPTERWERVCP